MRGAFTLLRRHRLSHDSQINAAFTLIEVVLALGIASFAVLTMVALLPVGIASTKDSLDESVALNILSEIISDRKATPLTLPSKTYEISALTPGMSPITNTFGIQDNNQATPSMSSARYRVDCSFTPSAIGTLGPYLGYFRVSWPANSATIGGCVEGVVTFPPP
jgi:type II secretory pathway pseudopilin PulG